MINRKFFIHFIISILISSAAHAQEIREFFNGARAMGMGGAQIAVANDETALLSNPAGLGKLRDFYGTFLDPEWDWSQNDQSIYVASPFSSILDPGTVAPALVNSKDVHYHVRGNIFPSLVVKNFGIGLYFKNVLDMKMDAAGANVETFYQDDQALILGYNFSLFDGRVKFGFTGKLISRIEINKTIAYPGDFTLQTNASEGAAIGADAGLILTGPWTYLPTLAIVARDVGSTQFTAGKNIRATTATIPAAQTMDYDIALALFPIHSSNSRSSFTIEVQKVLAAQTSVDQIRHLHVGWELNNSDFFFLRAGTNGHSWTAGAELSSTDKLQFQIATYGEDIGQGSNITEDRRYILKFAYRF